MAWIKERPAAGGEHAPGWERELLERLALESLREQRRARRWGIFFKLALLAYLVALLGMAELGDLDAAHLDGRHTALVEVSGIIVAGGEADADTIIDGLRDAFEDERSAAVIVRINSPGGSPVQAGYVYDEIRRLRKEHPDTRLYAVIGDIGASGGYYIAAAADEIYADKASLVGSVGVRMDGFGFVAAMEKLGVERRLLTAGEHKGILDPFSPARPEETEHVQGLLDEIHRQFVAKVKEGRAGRIEAADEEVFNGLIWTGEGALALGLVDGLGSAAQVAREVVGEERIVDFTPRKDVWEQLAEDLGSGAGQTMARLLGGGMGLR